MKILVSGAGITGCAATLFLRAAGHDVVTVDQAPAFRRLGYMLSLKYFGLGIVGSLGLLDDVRRVGIPYRTTQVYDAKGGFVQEFPLELLNRAVKGSLFMLRSGMHQVLFTAADKAVPVRFGVRVAGIAPRESAVDVAWSDGRAGRFDLVVVAEGLRSTTRRMLWGDEGFRPFDVVYSATVVEGSHGVPERVCQLFLEPGTTVQLFPLPDGKLVIQSYFRGAPGAGAPADQARSLMRQACRGFPPRIRDLVDRVADTAFVFCDGVGMVGLPDLSKGRVVLLGDAGYCPSYLSGMGASMGLLGAEALDKALRETPDVPAALASFNGLMQPVIAHYHRAAVSNLDLLLTRNTLRTWWHTWAMRRFPPALLVRQLARQRALETSLLRGFGPLEVA